MSQKYDKLKNLLKELFQLDQPDLDFGLYRLMHAKSAEVSQLLDQALKPKNRLKRALLVSHTWKVRLIEEDFHRLMFDTEGA